MSAQRALFTEDGEDVKRRVYDLLGRAFELHTEADDLRDTDDAERARLRKKAVKLEVEADGIVPVEERQGW
jgi:hypothetical protein